MKTGAVGGFDLQQTNFQICDCTGYGCNYMVITRAYINKEAAVIEQQLPYYEGVIMETQYILESIS